MGKLKCLNQILVLVTGPLKAPAIYTTKIIKANLENGINVLTLLDFSEPNTKYVIKWDFDLKGQIITIPENCVIEFDGGSLNNGTLIGADTYIITYLELEKVLLNIDMLGTYKYSTFGTVIDYNADEEGSPTDQDLTNLVVNEVIENISNNFDFSLRITNIVINQLEELGLLSLGDLTDVNITSPELGQVLKYDGEKWVNDYIVPLNPTLDIQDQGEGSYVIIVHEDEDGDGVEEEKEVTNGTQIPAGTSVTIEITPEGTTTETVATPTIDGDTPFTTSTLVTMSCATVGATIYYTENTTNPSNSSTAYVSPITLALSTPIKAIAMKASAVKVFTFTMPNITPEVIINKGLIPSVTVNGTSIEGHSKGLIASSIASKVFIKETGPTTHTVTLNVTNGKIQLFSSNSTSTTANVLNGSKVEYTIIPNSGYLMPTTAPTVSGATVRILENNKISIENVTLAVTVNLTCIPEEELPLPTITLVPTNISSNITYNGTAQNLVNGGTATNGTVYYKVTTTNDKPTDTSGFSATIPTSTNAGTYYIWYYVKGNTGYSDTDINNEAIVVNILTKPITITAKEQIFWYPKNSIDTDVNKVTVNGIAENDTLVSIALRATSTEMGLNSGAIVPSVAVIKNGNIFTTDNYNITYVPGDLKILQAIPRIINDALQTITNIPYNSNINFNIYYKYVNGATNKINGEIILNPTSGDGWTASYSTENNKDFLITITNTNSSSSVKQINTEDIQVIFTPTNTEHFESSEDNLLKTPIILNTNSSSADLILGLNVSGGLIRSLSYYSTSANHQYLTTWYTEDFTEAISYIPQNRALDIWIFIEPNRNLGYLASTSSSMISPLLCEPVTLTNNGETISGFKVILPKEVSVTESITKTINCLQINSHDDELVSRDVSYGDEIEFNVSSFIYGASVEGNLRLNITSGDGWTASSSTESGEANSTHIITITNTNNSSSVKQIGIEDIKAEFIPKLLVYNSVSDINILKSPITLQKNIPVESLVFVESGETLRVKKGSSILKTVSILPSNASNLMVDWTISNASIVSLDKSSTQSNFANTLRGNAVGTCQITVSANGNSNIKLTYPISCYEDVPPTYTLPTAKTLTYNGSEQSLVNEGESEHGTFGYKLSTNNSWTSNSPKGTNAGNYTVEWTFTADLYHRGETTSPRSINITISPKTVNNPIITLSQSTYTYNGSACQPTPTVKDGEIIIPSSEYTVSYSNNVNVGTATVIITDKSGGNYTVNGSTTFTIVQSTPEQLVDNEGYVIGDEFPIGRVEVEENSKYSELNGKILTWATKNLGASTPLDSGLFYSWGNIDGYQDPTTFFNDGSSAGNMGDGTSNLEFNSYNFNLEDYQNTGGYNLITNIPVNSTYDAAYAVDGEWRIPTKIEYEYLIENYSPELVTKDGIQGVKFTRTLVGGDTISMFLPLSGAIIGGTNDLKGDAGYFWTSTIDPSTISNKDAKQAYFAAYDENNISDVGGSMLCYLGLPIRPIKVTQ